MSRKWPKITTPKNRRNRPTIADLFGCGGYIKKNFLKRLKSLLRNRAWKQAILKGFQLCELKAFKAVLTAFKRYFNAKFAVFQKRAKKAKSLRPQNRGFRKNALFSEVLS